MIIKSSIANNYTPTVMAALASIKASGGGCIEFEKGEFHFYKEGSLKTFFAVSNNTPCDKHVVFPIFNMKNVKIKGNGAAFVFHETVFPFAIMDSEDVELSEFSVDTGVSPIGFYKVGEKTEEGFYLHFDRKENPYRIESGSIIFKRENGELSGRNKKFDLHGISKWGVQYLFTGDCCASRDNLPAKHISTNVEQRGNELFFKYKEDNIYPLMYPTGASISILFEERNSDVIFLHKSKNTLVKNITVRRGVGMGIIAQLSENIEIAGFKTDENYHGIGATLTADSMHFVNCSGSLNIHDCEITHTMDDIINVHGMYTRIKEIIGNIVTVEIGHYEQYYFNPYICGDTVKSLSGEGFEYTSEMKIIDSSLSDDGKTIRLKVEVVCGKADVNDLIESPYRMPNVHVFNNKFFHYPNIRLSGAGDILVENNSFEYAISALVVKDLAKYWYESGRVKNLVFRNNTMKDCNKLAGNAFIIIDVPGVEREKTPKIHDHIEITNNRFEGIQDKAIIAAGVQDLIIKENVFVNGSAKVIEIDGKA